MFIIIIGWFTALTSALLSLSLFLAPYSELAANLAFKFHLFSEGLVTFLFSHDKVWKKTYPDPDLIKDKATAVKRIVFIRHGESEWNEVFNKGLGPGFIVRLITAIVREILCLPTRDSIFIDSSLSEEGIQQALELRRFLESYQTKPSSPVKSSESANSSNALQARSRGGPNDEIIQLLKGARGDEHIHSVIVTSNLRRALETGAIALHPRIHVTQERVAILSSLQEVTFNVDGNTLTEAHGVPIVSLHKLHHHRKLLVPSPDNFEAAWNYGQKSLSINGLDRMMSFCEWAFGRDEDTIIISSGHSFWIRFFFRTFFPPSAVDKYDVKKRKLVNCGVLSFDLQSGTHMGQTVYRIHPQSVKVVYGGFTGK